MEQKYTSIFETTEFINIVTNIEQINDLLVEMNDRFGTIPKEFLNLFKLDLLCHISL